MATASPLSSPLSPLQSRQMSGASSSCSGAFLGDQSVVRQLSSGFGFGGRTAGRSGFQRGAVFAHTPQQHQHSTYGSTAESLTAPVWAQDAMLAAVNVAQAVRVVSSPTHPDSAWLRSPETPSQFARCNWPKQQKVDEVHSAAVMFVDEEEPAMVEEGQQLHEEFAVLKRSRSEQQLVLKREEVPLGPRSAWPRVAVSADSVEQILGPRCAWPQTPLNSEAEERVLGPRCEWPRKAETASVAAPLVVAGPACAWPKQSASALLAVTPEVAPLYPRCEWPRKESTSVTVSEPETVGARCAWPSAKAVVKMGAARTSKVKQNGQGWPWAVVSVGLEPIPDHDEAEGPRCAWPRMQHQFSAENPARLPATSVPVPAGPRCEWPAKQATPPTAPPANPLPALGPRCSLKKVDETSPARVLAAACAWPRKEAVQAISREEQHPVLGPRCALKLPEEKLGPRCELKFPAGPVLGPRCALKTLAVEEVRLEGPRCIWPKPGSEVALLVAQLEKKNEASVEAHEDVAPAKVQRKRVGVLPRRGLFTNIPVRYSKGQTLARVGKVKVAQPQPEAGKEVAKPAEKAAAAWPRRLLATSLGLGALNQALLRSQAEVAALEVPAVMWKRLESHRSLGSDSASQDRSS